MNAHRVWPRILAVAALVAASALVASPAHAAVKCKGKKATIVGTGGANLIRGSEGRDVIVGGGGNDYINARGGKDLICAGAGDDFATGSRGADNVFGSFGNDYVRGGSGDDEVFAEAGADIAAGDDDDDLVDGGAGNDSVYGGEGDDQVFGRGGTLNLMYGNTGNDTLTGADGQEYLLGQDGDDILNGAGGPFDIVSFFFANNPDGVSANLATGSAVGEGTDTLLNAEALEGSFFSDQLYGNEVRNFFYPLKGDDLVSGAAEADMVSFFRSPAGVTAELVTGTATGEGADLLLGIEQLQGTSLKDSLTGNLVDNALLGLDGNDTLAGGALDDYLDGGNGDDTGDGGPQGVNGDTCVSVETRVDCEIVPTGSGSSAPQSGTFGMPVAALRLTAAPAALP